MSIPLIIVFFAGVLLAIFGGRIMLSDKALDQMYEWGIWKKATPPFDEKSGRRFDRYNTGGRILLVGLIMVVGSIIVFLLAA